MRCHYMSDLHLESQPFDAPLPKGWLLLLAGDLCHARCLAPDATSVYHVQQRERVLRFVDRAHRSFEHIVLVAGNHDHYDGVLDDTTAHLRRYLEGVTVLDDETIVLGGIRFFGSTLWTDLDRGNPVFMRDVKRRMGEYFFVRKRSDAPEAPLRKLQPEDTLAAHCKAWSALTDEIGRDDASPLVVVTHHSPSLEGLNPQFRGDVLDSAYASDLAAQIERHECIRTWVHGHTHIARRYRIGGTAVCSNALGFAAKGRGARGFSPSAYFDVDR